MGGILGAALAGPFWHPPHSQCPGSHDVSYPVLQLPCCEVLNPRDHEPKQIIPPLIGCCQYLVTEMRKVTDTGWLSAWV